MTFFFLYILGHRASTRFLSTKSDPRKERDRNLHTARGEIEKQESNKEKREQEQHSDKWLQEADSQHQ